MCSVDEAVCPLVRLGPAQTVLGFVSKFAPMGTCPYLLPFVQYNVTLPRDRLRCDEIQMTTGAITDAAIKSPPYMSPTATSLHSLSETITLLMTPHRAAGLTGGRFKRYASAIAPAAAAG